MTRSTKHYSAFVLAALLFPGLLQTTDCNSTAGDASLASLEVVADGLDRVIAFRPHVVNYTIGTTLGIDTITVNAVTSAPSAKVKYRLHAATIESGLIGIGGGQIDLTIPIDTPVTLSLEVSNGSTLRTYNVEINPRCVSTPCDDGNACSDDVCNPASICEFTALADLDFCDFDGGNGFCSGGLCMSSTTVLDFESFGPADQGERFGIGIDRIYEGVDFAYDDPNQIADGVCTVATVNPSSCWGSWGVSDVASDGLAGASGSDNWAKARVSGVGKGAKITYQAGFVFQSMQLFTRDSASFPSFLEEVTVTLRDINNVDTSIVVNLQADTWLELTAADLGVAGVTLKSMWFTAPGVSNPETAKFGLDDLALELL